jgi:hypothetical protein
MFDKFFYLTKVEFQNKVKQGSTIPLDIIYLFWPCLIQTTTTFMIHNIIFLLLL